MICVTTENAVDIQAFSAFPAENEVLLPPGVALIIADVCDLGHGLTMVKCEDDTSAPSLVPGWARTPTVSGAAAGGGAAAGPRQGPLQRNRDEDMRPSLSQVLTPIPTNWAAAPAPAPAASGFTTYHHGQQAQPAEYVNQAEEQERHAAISRAEANLAQAQAARAVRQAQGQAARDLVFLVGPLLQFAWLASLSALVLFSRRLSSRGWE
jgi:hypothetical protein